MIFCLWRTRKMFLKGHELLNLDLTPSNLPRRIYFWTDNFEIASTQFVKSLSWQICVILSDPGCRNKIVCDPALESKCHEVSSQHPGLGQGRRSLNQKPLEPAETRPLIALDTRAESRRKMPRVALCSDSEPSAPAGPALRTQETVARTDRALCTQ